MLCPDCQTADAARELVLANGFWTNALAAAGPLVLILLAVMVLARSLDSGDSRGRD